MRTLRSRLILSHIIPVLIILPVAGIILVYLFETQVLLGNISNELVRQAELVANSFGSSPEIWFDSSRAEAFVKLVSPQVTSKVMLLDPEGRLIVSSDSQDSPLTGQVFDQNYIQSVLNGETMDPEVIRNQAEISEVVAPVVTSNSRLLGFVRLVNPLSDAYARSQDLRRISLWVLGAGLILGIILGWRLAADLEKPLRALTQAIPQLGSAHEPIPLSERGPEEINLLVRAVNALIVRLHTLEESRKRLLSNLVHELGTPLGALHSGVQALLRGAAEDENLRKELLLGIDTELNRLQSLLDELAHLHDQVLGPLELNTVSVNINEWIQRIGGAWRQAAQEKGLDWQMEASDQLPPITMDPDRMAQALGNLISNAIRYTPSGGKIQICAEEKDGVLNLQVMDTGPGLTQEEISQIFQPFFRGKAARRFSRGMGLGLTITRDLVQAHGGKLLVDSVPDQGSTFSIQLPLD
ncbi:MAG TPA: HAMP domain-containing sensor histidine kinase [Anaerolineaceae bacterium]|nr:HAMP domain-containing sensor histidine kinase [Anaerolineaceae bacterium]